MFEYSIFTMIYIQIEQMAFVGTLCLNLIPCIELLFFSYGSKKPIARATAVVKRWRWQWCKIFEKFLTIMMSISWKVGEKVFIYIFFSLPPLSLSPSQSIYLRLIGVWVRFFFFVWSFFTSFGCHLWIAIDICVKQAEAFRYLQCFMVWSSQPVNVLFQFLFCFLFSVLFFLHFFPRH